MRFKKTRRGIEAHLDEAEVSVLRRCAEDLLTLLADEEDDEEAPGRDPLEAMVGLPAHDPQPPRDPALARLLPDAYGRDDPDGNREFRRYTEADLRAGKRAHGATVLATLPQDGSVRLDRDQADAWLGFLNDVRLVLGVRLGVTEDLDPDDLDPEDPQSAALMVYSWLGWVQESLLRCLTPRH